MLNKQVLILIRTCLIFQNNTGTIIHSTRIVPQNQRSAFEIRKNIAVAERVVTMKHYMQAAYNEALLAAKADEVPVGCIIVCDGVMIAKAHNLCVSGHDATAHAELLAIREACAVRQTTNLSGCELYVSMEPCPMCAGAIINAKISKLVYGCSDFVYGACGGNMNLMNHPYAKNIEVYGGIMEQECAELLKAFFAGKR